MSEPQVTTSGTPVIQVTCPTCGAQPRQRCKTKSQMESRNFHAARYRVDPPKPYDGEVPAEDIHVIDSLSDEHRRISREVTTGQRYGKLKAVTEVKTPPSIDPEVEELEAAIYNRALGANIDRGLQTALLRTMDTGRVQPRFQQGNKKKTDRRRAKNRVAKASRKRNRK